MTDNDYIAEFVKEKHPGLLGVDFAFWKFTRKVKEGVEAIVDIFRNTTLESEDEEDEERSVRDLQEREECDDPGVIQGDEEE